MAGTSSRTGRESPAGPATPSRAADELLSSAASSLDAARTAGSPAERYAAAHLAALRAAAAVIAARGRGRTAAARGSRVRSVWLLLPAVAAELGEWAEFFAASAKKRAYVEAGLPCVSVREADDLVREADAFIDRVAGVLGVRQLSLPGSLVPAG